MNNCTAFPERQSSNIVFYITNVILVPVLFGIGLMGNLITSVLCNHSSLRKENAVYIHICGLAIMDAVILLCTVPRTLQEVEIFPANVTYSRFMAYADMGSYIFGNIAHHAALWLMVTLGFIQLYMSKNPYTSSRVSLNSTNRMIVFVSVMICALFNFPRFLEVGVREVVGHCFWGMSLWDFKITPFGQQNFTKLIFPWAIIAICYILPMFLILIVMLLLGASAGWRKLRVARLALNPSHDDEKRRLGLLKAVWVLLLAGFCLEVPNLVVEVFTHAYPMILDDNTRVYVYSSRVVASYLGLVRASVSFMVYTIYCSDFRKALRRTFCCLCRCADEFYEPCACCNPIYRRELKATKEAEEKKMRKEARKKRRASQDRKSSKSKSDTLNGRSSRAPSSYDSKNSYDLNQKRSPYPPSSHENCELTMNGAYLSVPNGVGNRGSNYEINSSNSRIYENGSAHAPMNGSAVVDGRVSRMSDNAAGSPWV